MFYFPSLLQSLGKVGKVILIEKDGDVRVQFSGPIWTFSPAALKKVPASTEVSGDSGGKFPFVSFFIFNFFRHGSPSVKEKLFYRGPCF